MMKPTNNFFRKSATGLLLVQWSRFSNIPVRLNGSTLFTGINGSGKSTILDAMTYLLTGNTQFNKAAQDKERSVRSYVRGDTKSNGEARYLRKGEVISYIAMEFFSPDDNESFVVGVCIESRNESTSDSKWFVLKNARLDDINFYQVIDDELYVFPKSELYVGKNKVKMSSFMNKEKGIEQVMRALGMRCNADKYRSKLVKMMFFKPENNVDKFIQESVLDEHPINALQELREQKERFDKIKGLYNDLKLEKNKLEQIEDIVERYEEIEKQYRTRKMLFMYQNVCLKEKDIADLNVKKESIRIQIESEKQKSKKLEEDYKDALDRYNTAENSVRSMGIDENIRILEQQLDKINSELERLNTCLSEIESLQKNFQEILESDGFNAEIDEDLKNILLHLTEEGITSDKKLSAYLEAREKILSRKEMLNTEKVHLNDRKNEYKKNLEDLDDNLKKLSANIVIFPDEIIAGKKAILNGFKEIGIRTNVRFFAELVESLKDPKWRLAIETFLGRKRYNIIVDGRHCHEAMEILHKSGLYNVNVVITDKLPESEIRAGSAAEQLEIPNVYARRYANYLLNGIHLCSTLEELHQHPKGGLMCDGTLAKGYTMSNMNLNMTKVCFGMDVIELQKKSTEKEKAKVQKDLKETVSNLNKCVGLLQKIESFDLKKEDYNFNAARDIKNTKERSRNTSKAIEDLKNNPEWIALVEERDRAEKVLDSVRKDQIDLNTLIGSLKKDIENKETQLDEYKAELFSLTNKYDEFERMNLELKRPMREMFEKLKKQRNSMHVITEKTVDEYDGKVRVILKEMEDAQVDYCKLAGLDLYKRGASFIAFFRDEYKSISNVKIEKVHEQLEEQSKKLENAFMSDFVAELSEAISEAQHEIDLINDELVNIPFGNDTYQFKMTEKPDRSMFFSICKKLSSYMDSPGVYMNSDRDDEELEENIRDFLDIILMAENEEEFTDYRRYFNYDMEILSRQGKERITSELSKKQGSASNGEKQTPYFIILAASLLQCYPSDKCCARLAFIDEAFSALSRERIEQMVRFFENNNFQVIYAAPPEKISSIGTYINSTVSLVMTGRYTNAVEGLVSVDEFYDK